MRFARSLIVAAGVLIAASCGGDDDGDDTTSATDPSTSATAGATVASAAGGMSPGTDTGAGFVYAYPVTVSNLDPHLASISQDGTTLFPAYDRLIHSTPDGELIPGLAESWEFNADATELTLAIRRGVTFHDGAALDAEAVKTSLDRAKSLESSVAATDLQTVATVDVIDPMTVRLTMSAPSASIVGPLSDRAGIIISPQALADGVDLQARMVGAGPYRMIEHVPGATTTFELFEDYWNTGERPAIATLEIRVIADSATRYNALVSGQIDATSIDPNQVPDLERTAGFTVVPSTQIAYFFLAQNRSLAMQDDVRVRQAFVHALDREGMCEALLNGMCEVTDQPVPPGHPVYDDSIDQVLYEFDPERTRTLLAEAGAQDLTLSMVIPAALPPYPAMAEVIQAQFADVGITLDLTQVEPPQIGNNFFVEQATEAMLAQRGGRPDPAMNWMQRAGAEGFANPGGVTTERMTEILDASNAEPDLAARTDLLVEGSREMAESVLEIPLMYPVVPYAMRSDVSWTPFVSSILEFRDVTVAAG